MTGCVASSEGPTRIRCWDPRGRGTSAVPLESQVVPRDLSCAYLLLSSCKNTYKDVNAEVDSTVQQSVHLESVYT